MIEIDQPRTITREAYLALIKGAGFDPMHLESLEFRRNGIHATVLAQDENGRHFIDEGPGEPKVAKHRVFIRVVDEA